MKTLLAFTILCALMAITGCSGNYLTTGLAILGFGCLMGLVFTIAFVAAKLYHSRQRKVKIGKAWERKMRCMNGRKVEPEILTEFHHEFAAEAN